MKLGLPEIGPLERALYLRSLAIFRDLGASELAACAQLTQERYFRRGELLYEEGQPVRSLYLLVDGRVHLAHCGRRLRHLEASEDVGLVELLADQPHHVRAVADTNLLALLIDAAAFVDLVEEHFSLFLQIRHALGAEVARQQRALGSYHTFPDARPIGHPVALNGGVKPRPPAARDLAEVLLALQRTAVFRNVGLALLAALASEGNEVSLAPGAPLWELGAEPGFLALIAAGSVSCVPDQPRYAFRAGSGAVLGVDAAFGGTPYAYRAVAETPVIAHRIGTQMLLDIAEDHFDLASRILAHCAGELLRLKSIAATQRQAQASEDAEHGSVAEGAR